jgi:hypothetical protein
MGHPSQSFVRKNGRKRSKTIENSLAQILPTGALDYIFDDSGEKILLRGPYGPVRVAKNRKIAIFARDTRL